MIKNVSASAGDTLVWSNSRFDPWVRKIPWKRNGNLQYSCLGNPMNRGPWQATVLGLQRVRHDWVTDHHFFTLCVDWSLLCSCSKDWASVHHPRFTSELWHPSLTFSRVTCSLFRSFLSLWYLQEDIHLKKNVFFNLKNEWFKVYKPRWKMTCNFTYFLCNSEISVHCRFFKNSFINSPLIVLNP